MRNPVAIGMGVRPALDYKGTAILYLATLSFFLLGNKEHVNKVKSGAVCTVKITVF